MDPRVEAVRRIIEAEYKCRLTVPELVRRAGVSRSHLASLFKSETGLPVRAYLREVRMRRASELLRGGGTSIKEALQAVGYHDASNFARNFRSQFGRTASQYRREAASGPTPVRLG